MDLRHIDIDAIVERYGMTLARRNHDRPVFNISFGLGKQVEPPPAPPGIRERWFNFEWRLDCFERYLENVGFLYEGFPGFFCNLGPDVLAALTGSDLTFAEGTSWAEFRVSDWRDEPPIRFQEEGFYWRSMKQFLELSAQRGRGRWLTDSGDLHTNGDGLAALRGPENLLMDLYDCPDEIKKRLGEMHAVFETVLEAHFAIIHPSNDGLTSSWCRAACRGRFAAIQNDFSCMVGPGMFDEFFKEYVEKESACLDYSIYHLDGPDALRHLESICDCKHVDAIQWVPGEGEKPTSEWLDVYRRVCERGKGCWIHGTPEDQLKILAALEPEGCMYNLWFNSEEEARHWLRSSDRILKEKRRLVVSFEDQPLKQLRTDFSGRES